MFSLDQGGRLAGVTELPASDTRLGPIAEHVAFDEASMPPDSAARWRVIADDCPYIIWSCETVRERGSERLMLVGPRRVFADIDRSARVATIGIRLRPGATTALFGIHAAELCDRAVPLQDVAGPAGTGLVRRLSDMVAEDVAVTLTSFVAERERCARRIDDRVSAIRQLASDTSQGAGSIALSLGMSPRSLRALCARELGMGLKHFLRIRRLHRALKQSLNRPGSSWSRIAMGCGYTDHSHLVKDFHALLGESPRDFTARRVI